MPIRRIIAFQYYHCSDMNLDQFPGVNAGFVLELYERFRRDPGSVDPQTRAAFERWAPDAGTPPSPESRAPAPGVRLDAVVGAANLAESIRRYGHLGAHIDPLGAPPLGDPALSPAAHGITDDDLRQLP